MAIERDPGFAARVREAISRWGAAENESIREAATRIDITHVMLQRALDGRVPNATGLKKIAKANNVSVDWLLTGEGAGPRKGRFSAALEWAALVRELGLPEDAQRVMLAFPKSAMTLVYGIIADDAVQLKDGSQLSLGWESPELLEAVRAERRFWVKFFRDWIKAAGNGDDDVGVARVRAWVIAQLEWFERRTGPIDRTKRPRDDFLKRGAPGEVTTGA